MGMRRSYGLNLVPFVYRVLKSEGYIIVGLIDKESNLGKKYEAKKGESKFYKNANFHSVVEIKEKLEKSGFTKEYLSAQVSRIDKAFYIQLLRK